MISHTHTTAHPSPLTPRHPTPTIPNLPTPVTSPHTRLQVLAEVFSREPDQQEFMQAVREVAMSLQPVFDKRPELLPIFAQACAGAWCRCAWPPGARQPALASHPPTPHWHHSPDAQTPNQPAATTTTADCGAGASHRLPRQLAGRRRPAAGEPWLPRAVLLCHRALQGGWVPPWARWVGAPSAAAAPAGACGCLQTWHRRPGPRRRHAGWS